MKEFEIFIRAKSDKSIHTKKMYYDVISKFLESMKVETIEDLQNLTANQLREYILSMNISASSKNSKIRVLKSFFSFLFDNDFLTINQMDKVKKQSEKKVVTKVPTLEEMNYIFDNCKNEVTKLLLLLTSRVGLRREEVTNIRLEDIFADGRLLVQGKGNKEAVLKLPKDIFEEVMKYVSHKNRVESEFLFSYAGHKVSPTSIYMRIREYIESLKLTNTEEMAFRKCHTYRHYCGTTVYNKTHDPYQVKHQLRHSDIIIGQRYVHPNEVELDALSASL